LNFEEYERMNQFEVVNWWWAGKRQLVARTLGKLVGNKPLILDVGCGTGSNLKGWEPFGDVLGMDISTQALDFCKIKGNSNLVKGDATALPFHDNTFEVIIALDMLEHMEKDSATVKEFSRICRQGGYLVITVPALMFLWSKHDVALHHKRRYAREELRKLLSSNGFKVERLTFWNFSLFLPASFYRVLGNLKPPKQARSDDLRLPGPANWFFKSILHLENTAILNGLNFPCGISLYAVCRKA